jgi:hypothetical protein
MAIVATNVIIVGKQDIIGKVKKHCVKAQNTISTYQLPIRILPTKTLILIEANKHYAICHIANANTHTIKHLSHVNNN